MATLTETDISESRKAFDSCDLDGDGFLDSAEFRRRWNSSTGTYPAQSVS